jgi:protoheme IX farnesyltransferase
MSPHPVVVAAGTEPGQLSRGAELGAGIDVGTTAAGHGQRDGRRPFSALARAYIALTKPRIIELLLVTTVPAMLLADRGLPSLWLIVATLAGGTMAAGSANTINCYVDRDIDRVMARTSRRPLVRASVTPTEALRFGIVLGIAATVLFGFAVNWPSALLADAAIMFYVLVYTLGLKRRTPSNIVIGGAAGCFPVLIGWSAVTGTVGWSAVLLFAVIFFWTPPHFWALAMKFKDDYAAAGVPMLPVVASPRTVTRRILFYSYAMVAASLALVPVAHTGPFYLAAAAVLGGWFLVEAHVLVRQTSRGTRVRPMRLFHLSITYLTLLFAAVAVTALIS